MAAVSTFQLQSFELAQGQHVARLRRLYEDDPRRGPMRRSGLWLGGEESRAELVAALALPANRRVLLTLAAVPEDCKVLWTIREVGGANTMDLVARIRRPSGGDVLLMVSCLAALASPARLREQAAQTVRTALSTMAKVNLADRPAWTKLVLLSGWRKGVRVPNEATPLPALQREPAVLDPVPEVQFWGFLPFVCGSMDDIFVTIAQWQDFHDPRYHELSREMVPVPWKRWDAEEIEGYGDGALMEVEEHGGRVQVSLRLKSSAHKSSLKEDRHGSRVLRRIRALRSACYSGHLSVGAGRFVGETIEDGIPRLHWNWAEGQAPSAEAARAAVVAVLARFGSSDDDPTTREPTG